MKLLSWNLNTNRGAAALALLIARESPDLVLLQEANAPVAWGAASTGGSVMDCSWGSHVITRTGTIEPMSIPGYEGWVAGARVVGDGLDLYVFSLHSPSGRPNAPRGSYVAECRAIVRAIAATVPRDALLVIGGDFNCSIGERTPDDPRPNSHAERRALVEWRAMGFSVAWRDSHPGAHLPQTLRWTNNPATPYHCDGFLLRGAGADVVSAQVLDEEWLRAVSDHNPVVCSVRIARAD